MLEIGCYVVKTMSKVCKVEDIVKLDSSKKDYYLLVPIHEQSAKIYIPVERAESFVRRVMTKEEVLEFIHGIPQIEEIFIDNEKLREQRYKEVLKSDDPKQLVGIIKMIYLRNRKREKQGKKNTVVDQRYFKMAEDYLYSELAFVLQKEISEVQELIKDACKKDM